VYLTGQPGCCPCHFHPLWLLERCSHHPMTNYMHSSSGQAILGNSSLVQVCILDTTRDWRTDPNRTLKQFVINLCFQAMWAQYKLQWTDQYQNTVCCWCPLHCTIHFEWERHNTPTPTIVCSSLLWSFLYPQSFLYPCILPWY
jgi:hypothetical protein